MAKCLRCGAGNEWLEGKVRMETKTPTPKNQMKKIKESDILNLFIDTLEPLVAQGKLRYIRHHPVRLVTRNGKTFTAPVNDSQLGAPDLVIFFPAECWLVEIKRPQGKLTPKQKEWRNWFLTVAHAYRYAHLIVDTVHEANRVIDLLLKIANRSSGIEKR